MFLNGVISSLGDSVSDRDQSLGNDLVKRRLRGLNGIHHEIPRRQFGLNTPLPVYSCLMGTPGTFGQNKICTVPR